MCATRVPRDFVPEAGLEVGDCWEAGASRQKKLAGLAARQNRLTAQLVLFQVRDEPDL